jgi:hypothetical protein
MLEECDRRAPGAMRGRWNARVFVPRAAFRRGAAEPIPLLSLALVCLFGALGWGIILQWVTT